MKELAEAIINKMPYHKISLSIEHNPHKNCYQSVEEYIRNCNIEEEDWSSTGASQIAIEMDSLWECRWYPDTPVGSFTVYAPSLSELLTAMMEFREKHNGLQFALSKTRNQAMLHTHILNYVGHNHTLTYEDI